MPEESRESISPYAGRWVARLNGRIVAQGGTPEQALRAAKTSRHKERPEIVFMPIPFSYSPLIDRVREALPEQEVYLVGGAVRDILLKRVSPDLDFAVPSKGISLARRVANMLDADFMPIPFSYSPLIDRVREALPEQEVYLVGGAVRDILLKRVSPDLDFAVPSKGISLARRVANKLDADFMVLDDLRDTGRVIVNEAGGARIYLDFATYRGSSLEDDLRARDFTMNAIAFNLQDQTLIDPLNGASDLRKRLIRACSPTSLKDDPVRILRAIRQAAAIGCKIQPETRQSMKDAAHLLPGVSAERLRDELFKILEGPKPDASLRALELLGILPYLLPELPALKGVTQTMPHIYDVWEHTLKVLSYLEAILAALAPGYNADATNDLFTGLLTLRIGRFREQFGAHFADSLNADRSMRSALFFAALYHDIEKPSTKSVGEDGRIHFYDHESKGAETAARRAEVFNLSNDEVGRIRQILLHHMRFHFFTGRMEDEQREPSRRAIYRFFRDTGEAGVDLVLLGLADLRGTYGPTLPQGTWTDALDVARILLENYWEKREQTVAPPRLLDGNDLMQELSLQPSRIIGQLLEAIREGQATGKVATREEALEYAKQQLKEMENQ